MKRKEKMVPEFDEIIFENRNREYGAYVIRKKYSVSAILSTVGGSLLFAGLVLLLAASTPEPVTGSSGPGTVIIIQPDTTIIDPNLYKVEPPKIKELPKIDYTAPPVVVDSIIPPEFQMKANASLDSVKNKPVDFVPEPQIDVIPPDDNGDPYANIGIIVSEMPEFPGGTPALMKFINENIQYPQQAVDNGLEGKVTLRFIVWKDGSIKKVEVFKGVDPILDKEAVRVISIMPNWKPGKNNGTPAAVWFTVPVKFELRKN
jgi:protein TonB